MALDDVQHIVAGQRLWPAAPPRPRLGRPGWPPGCAAQTQSYKYVIRFTACSHGQQLMLQQLYMWSDVCVNNQNFADPGPQSSISASHWPLWTHAHALQVAASTDSHGPGTDGLRAFGRQHACRHASVTDAVEQLLNQCLIAASVPAVNGQRTDETAVASICV